MMDANNTHYHLLLGRADWANCVDEHGHMLDAAWLASPVEHNDSGLEWDARRDELTLQPQLFQFASSPFEKALTLDQRRGAGRDRYGNWYWIGESNTELRVYSSGSGRSAHFWSAGDGVECAPDDRQGDFQSAVPSVPIEPLPLSGLAVTKDHYLVVGVLKPPGLLIFDLHAGGSPMQVKWLPAVPFVPFDMAPRPGGGVWILDRVNHCYWALDRHLNVVRLDNVPETLAPDDFQPMDQSKTRQQGTRPFPEPITLGLASPIAALDPIAIEALPDGSVLILDNPPGTLDSLVWHYRLATPSGQPVSTDAVRDVVQEQDRGGFHLRGYDMACLPNRDDKRPTLLGKLFITMMNGNQTYAFDVFESEHQLKLQALAEYYPMRLFSGKALVNAGDRPYYDFGEAWIPLVEQKRPRYEPQAALLTPILDGHQPDCVWHRLMVDASLPPECAVDVWSRAADERPGIERAAWFREPRLHKRDDGSELPFARQINTADRGTFELLFQRARGQYLQLRLVLRGDGRSTPRLRALRAYYPRFSYLEHYVPGVYREDAVSASFLNRFLANPEGLLTALEDKIAAVQMLFDVRSAPVEALDWLADWFGVALDPVWDETRRRLFIKHAMDFFLYRGTQRGLVMALHLALDSCVDDSIFTIWPSARPTPGQPLNPRTGAIRVVEKYRTRRTPPVVLGDPTELNEPQLIPPAARWTPDQGRDDLNRRYQAALGLAATEVYPIRDPGDERSILWRRFSRDTLGCVPTAGNIDVQQWRKYLSDRYSNVNALNTAYGLTIDSFNQVPLPDRLPAGDAPSQDWFDLLQSTHNADLIRWQHFLARRYSDVGALNTAYNLSGANGYPTFAAIPLLAQLPRARSALQDWFQFESVVVVTRRAAHQFTVMLPAPTQLTPEERQRRLDLAMRVIDLERPAHTRFDVKFYWAMFRVGQARLGQDTLIHLGSRAPELLPPFVLGQNYISEGYLAPGHPQNVSERSVIGRDRLKQ